MEQEFLGEVELRPCSCVRGKTKGGGGGGRRKLATNQQERLAAIEAKMSSERPETREGSANAVCDRVSPESLRGDARDAPAQVGRKRWRFGDGDGCHA